MGGCVVVRYLVRDVVKFGHYEAYKAACKTWNEVAVKLGLPAFRYYASNWGTANEVFLEAEFEDSGDIERRFAAAEAVKDPAMEAAMAAVASHIADGQTFSYVLSDLDLG
jgi:hypothetical protein